MKISLRTTLSVLLLALPVHSLAPPSKPTGKLSSTSDIRPAPTSFDDIVTLESSDERDASRRLFMTSLVGLGLLTAMDPAEAAMMEAKPMSSSASSSTTTTSDTAVAAVDWNGIVQKASKRALGGGKAGASAAVVQVCSLMWLRTSMNYQYRYGGNLGSSLKTLWDEGGVGRLYQGLPFALVQGPMTRFGDTAANVGVLALLESYPGTQDLPLPLKTACGSIAAGAWRIVLMPVDTSKTAMQVEGAQGLQDLWNEVLVVRKNPGPLYRGAFASAAATAVGHFPWFLTYNWLNEQLPQVSSTDDLLLSLGRAAFLGLCSSCVSDVCSNSLRVIKTTKQTAGLAEKDEEGNARDLSYPEIVSIILEKDGVVGLLGRGLQTRLLTNAIQGSVFSVLWKYFQMQN
ncbi:Mitochondrial carrier protein [Seminavis robusta]|uniref:Mitochondrial carrier protein n=1 Tax=Seminavis robusta TaxID=568900 RepID=A0A9N8E520_9STRA|nr:Mitochondrial carrier protein [Seminavis robusta]|eukprot:Sro625_g177620.1 Mitochondrial carrier protein (401) ;mRNA; r:37154-38454